MKLSETGAYCAFVLVEMKVSNICVYKTYFSPLWNIEYFITWWTAAFYRIFWKFLEILTGNTVFNISLKVKVFPSYLICISAGLNIRPKYWEYVNVWIFLFPSCCISKEVNIKIMWQTLPEIVDSSPFFCTKWLTTLSIFILLIYSSLM